MDLVWQLLNNDYFIIIIKNIKYEIPKTPRVPQTYSWYTIRFLPPAVNSKPTNICYIYLEGPYTALWWDLNCDTWNCQYLQPSVARCSAKETSRSKYTSCSHSSDLHKISAEVPQGSESVPTAFFIHIGDLLFVKIIPIHSFADDSTVLSNTRSNKLSELDIIRQAQLKSLRWFQHPIRLG